MSTQASEGLKSLLSKHFDDTDLPKLPGIDDNERSARPLYNALPEPSALTQSIIDAGQARHAIDNAQWPIGQPVVFAADGSSPSRESQLGYVVGYPREGNKLFVYVPAMHDNRTAEPIHLCAIDENGIPKEQGAGIISPEAFTAQQAAAAKADTEKNS